MEFEHSFPQVPEDLSSVDGAQLSAWIAEINEAIEERVAAGDDIPVEAIDEWAVFVGTDDDPGVLGRIQSELTAREAAAEAKRIKLEGLRGKVKPPAVPAPAPVVVDEPPPTPDETLPALAARMVASKTLTNARTNYRVNAGDTINGWVELGEAVMAGVSEFGPMAEPGTKFQVAQITDYISTDAYLPDDMTARQATFLRREDVGLTAALCAPATVEYDLIGGSSDRTPVADSLRTYGAPRGKVKRVATPLLATVNSNGIGFWTAADDVNPSATKACSTIGCPTDEDFEIYGVYKCLEVQNLTQLSYPEWVAFYGRQLNALFSRKREVRFLDQMMTRAGAAITTTTIYGAVTSVLARFENLLNNYTENERYEDEGMVAIMPRWVRHVLSQDLWLRDKNGGADSVNRYFTDVGVTPVWAMDNPTSVTQYTNQAKGAVLTAYPSTFWAIVTRAGNFRRMDIGAVDLGITTERAYRDTAMLSGNRFRLFMEIFEGLIDMGLPTWRFEIAAFCGNGLIAPVADFGAEPCGTTTQTAEP